MNHASTEFNRPAGFAVRPGLPDEVRRARELEARGYYLWTPRLRKGYVGPVIGKMAENRAFMYRAERPEDVPRYTVRAIRCVVEEMGPIGWRQLRRRISTRATAIRCSTPYVRDLLTVPRLAVVLIAAVVVLSLPACANGSDNSESTSETASGSTLLPRNVVLTLNEVKEILPEVSQETATGEDETALGNPTATRSVTYATDDGSQRVVISVAQYQSSEDASSTYQEAVQGSLEAPGRRAKASQIWGRRHLSAPAPRATRHTSEAAHCTMT